MSAVALAPRTVPLGSVAVVGSARNRAVAGRLVERLQGAAASVSFVPSFGPARGASARPRPDLFVVAVRGRRDVRALAEACAPVLVLGPRCSTWNPSPDASVLVCLDGSSRGATSLPAALTLADALGLPVSFVTAAPPVGGDVARYLARHDILEGSHLARTASHLATDERRVSWDVVHGAAPRALIEHASNSTAALVVLNTHGHSTRTGVPIGRVPLAVALRSPVPVMLTTHRMPAPERRRHHFGHTRHHLRPTPGPRCHPRDVPSPAVVRPPLARAARRTWAGSWSAMTVAAVSALFVAALGVATASGPYARTAGTTLPANELVVVAGEPATTRGSILMTIVTQDRIAAHEVVWAWLSADQDVGEEKAIPRTVTAASRGLLTESLRAARAAALAYGARDTGDAMIVTTHGLGGPSAGLAIALELIDAGTPGDLTKGHTVAVTGALDAGGAVHAVGSVRLKAKAAARAGADLLLVPSANLLEAWMAAPDLRVLPVDSLSEALAVLDALGPA